MKHKVRIGLFSILSLLQLAVPLYMIYHWENVLSMGRQYYWHTAPVDPYDALRGRYVRLSFKEITGIAEGGLAYGQQAYAAIEADEKGYAYISKVSMEKPASEEYLKVKVMYVKDNLAHVELPFNRFYMREDLAAFAENVYTREAAQDGAVAVRIKDGVGVIENLYIGDKTITQYIKENSNSER